MMQTNPETQRNVGKTINTWAQSAGILIATGWGVYTFVYKEITLPKSAPINITLNLQLKKIGGVVTQGTENDLTAVEMKCMATNPSSRQIYLLPSAWIAHGRRITAANVDDSDFTEAAATALKDSNSLAVVNRHATIEKTEAVATGRLFADTMLKPGETTGRTIIFYVRKNNYDLVDLTVLMPCAVDARGIELEWTLTGDSLLTPTVYRLQKNGERTPLHVSEHSAKPFELQQSVANAEISLWPEGKTPDP